MSEAFVIAASQGSINSLSGKPYAEQVLPVVKEVLEKSGVPARRVQELHWFGGEEEYWFSVLVQRLDFSPDMARFQWQQVPILAHAMFQSLSRAIEVGERDLILLAQQAGDQVIVLLLASPTAVGRHNLAPRARVANRFSLSRQPEGLLKALRAALEKTEVDLEQVQRLASPARFSPAEIKAALPAAQPLAANPNRPSSDLFTLDALLGELQESDTALGCLVSPAAHGSSLVTLIERV